MSQQRKERLIDKVWSHAPNRSERQDSLRKLEESQRGPAARVAAWPDDDDDPIFIVYGKRPDRRWSFTLEYDWRLPERLTDADLKRILTRPYQQARDYELRSDAELPGKGWRWATDRERRESVELAYECARREMIYRFPRTQYKGGAILPPITKDQERIRRRENEKARIAAAVRGDLQVEEGSRLERIVAAHRLYEATGGKVDIRAAITRREMPDEEET